MDVTTKKCDVCGCLKKETNHWFVIFLDGPMIHIAALDKFKMMEEQCGHDMVYDVCGVECLHTKLSQLLEGK